MTVLEDILSQEIVQKLGWTLVHFIWQAAVVALLLAILLRLLRKSTPSLRYILACLALTLIVLLPVITIQLVPVSVPQSAGHIEPAPAPAVLSIEEMPPAKTIVLEKPVQLESVAPISADSWKQRTIETLEPALPYIVSGWLVGVFGLSLWHLGGWTQLQRLKRRMVKQVDDALHSTLKVLAQRLKVNRTVQLMESALVQIPTVVGWLRPVILLPASALTGLTSEQLEAILAHELAHIKRYDYLVNILQTAVEILGFYHPAVWWVSHKIRAERENCCDDLAVSISGDRVCYARALTSMEEIRAGRGQLAVAATGGNLLGRIRRLVGKDAAEKTSFSWIPAVTVILLIIALAIPTTLALTTKSNSLQAEPKINVPIEDKKTESAHKLKLLGLAVAMYANDHDENLPDSLKELKPYIRDEQDFNWLLDNIKYLGSGKFAQRNAALIPIAYDRELLEEADGTNILFLDFSVRFLDTKEFEKLDIKRAEFLIEVRFLSVSEDFLQNIGLNANSPDEAKDLFKLKSELLAAKTQNTILDGRNVNLLLKAVRAHKDAKVLAVPQVLCREDKTAEIRVFNNEIHFISGYTEPNRPSDKPEPTYDSVKEGISLSLKPKPTSKKNVDIEFELEITQVPVFEERQYKGKYPYKHLTVQRTTQTTRYIAHNGQTLLFGGHKIAKQQDGRTEQKDLLVLITAHIIGLSEQDKPAQADDLTVAESGKMTSDVIMQPGIGQSRIVNPNENVQKSDSQVWDDILLATPKEKESSAESIPVPVLAKSPTPSAQDKTIIQVDCLIVEVSPDLKMDRETTIQAENLLGNKISLRDTKVDVLLRKAAEATAPVEDETASDKRITQKKFETLVDTMTSKGYMKILMNPRIQVVDGKTAIVKSAQHVPIDTMTMRSTESDYLETKTKYEDVTDSLEITPNILEDGNITLQVEATISSKSIPKGIEQIPIVSTRKISTRVRTNSGESLIIGGLTEKAPAPGDNVKNAKKRTAEVLFILTPTIITPATDSQEKTDVRIKSKEAMVQRVYDISDLVETAADADAIIRRITETIEPDSWYKLSDKGEGTITPYPVRQPKKFAVLQTHKIHQKITRLLEDIRHSRVEQEKTKSATEQKPLMVQKLFKLKHHDASQMARILKPLLTKTGYISADERTNSLLVIDMAENLMRIEKIIAAFDVSVAKQTVQKSFKLKYRSPSQMAQILRPLLTKTGHVSADESTGILLLIDTPENLKRIEKIIAAFDVLQAEQTVQKFFKLKYYSTSQMAQILRPLLTKTGYISTDERTNSLLVIDTVENLKRIELIIAEYDVPKAEQTVTEIFEIRYGDPVEIVELLKKLINGRPDAGSIIEPGKEQIVLVPEPRRKWIIAKGSAEDMKQIGEWIAKLDRKEPVPTSLEQIDQQIIKQQKILKMRQESIDNDPVVKALSENMANAEAELIVARQKLADSHPEVRQKAEYLQVLKKRLDKRITALGKSFDDMMLPEPNLPLAPEVPLITNTWIENDMITVLQDIASMAGIPIIPDETVVGLVTAELQNVPLETALDIVLAGTPYVVKKTQYYYLVASAVEPPEIQKRVYSARKLFNLGKALLIYANDHEDKYPDSLHHLSEYSNVEELKWVMANVKYLAHGKTPAIRPDTVIAYDKKLLAERKGTNVLFNDCHVDFVKPERLKELGISATEILIEIVRLLSVSEEFLKDIGLDANSVSSSDAWSEHLLEDSAADPNTGTYSLLLDELHISFLLKAVQAHQGSKMLVTPRVMTREGKTASIAVMTEKYYVMGYNEPNDPSDKPVPKLDKVELGTRIWLTPTLTPDNENIKLDFKLEISQLKGIIEGKYKGKYPYHKPIVDVISTETRTVVPNGKTLLIGGLKMTEQIKKEPGAPRLRDLPLIGGLFKRSTIKEPRMLLVLVKPIIYPQQKAKKILRGQENSEEHIKSLGRLLEKKPNPPAEQK